jgi:hypothetical protein
MSILIVTQSNDNDSVSRVAEAVARKGGHTIRFDTDRYPTDVRLTAYSGSGKDERLTLTNEEGEFDLREVTAIWHRRINFAAHLPAELDRQLRHASIGEASAAAHGMLASVKALRMDHLRHIRHAENKQLQLQVGRELGFNTPRTLTTNDPIAVRAFAKSCEGGMVTKMLSSFAIYDEGKELVVFTNPVKPEDLADLSGLSLCPATFQELLPKSLEIRVTVVGHRIMAAAVDSQVAPRWSSHDSRLASLPTPARGRRKNPAPHGLLLFELRRDRYHSYTRRPPHVSRTQPVRRILLARTRSGPSDLRCNLRRSSRALAPSSMRFSCQHSRRGGVNP